MGARYYDPVIGRFLSVDPVKGSPVAPETVNRYAYANLKPYKYTDPTGRFGEFTAAGCAVSAAAGCAPGAAIGFVADAVLWTGAAIVAYEFGKSLNETVEADDGKALGDLGTKDDKGQTGKRPTSGDANSTYWPGPRDDGSVADGRRFGKDGEKEVDYDHSHGNHVGSDDESLGDHVHNWDKQPDGTIRRGPPCQYCRIPE
ncbi:RHS repeat-associated core domain protein [compost metagenome]